MPRSWRSAAYEFIGVVALSMILLNVYDPCKEKPAEKRRTADVRRFVSTAFTGGNVVLVTHNFNIRALTGISTISGEMVVLTPRGNDTFDIAGRIAPSAPTPRP